MKLEKTEIKERKKQRLQRDDSDNTGSSLCLPCLSYAEKMSSIAHLPRLSSEKRRLCLVLMVGNEAPYTPLSSVTARRNKGGQR